MLNWYLRYEPCLKVLDDRGATEVLDVGSGWFGLSWYWPHRVVQTDRYFTGGRPPADDRRGSAQFVCGTAERLPFADGSFDFVVSSDMMEHLPEDLRGPSVAELSRVARRGVLIGFPTGSAATTDRITARLLRMRKRPLPEWLQEHLEQEAYPDRQTVVENLPAGWEITEEHRSGNAFISALVGWGEMWGPTAGRIQRYEDRILQRGGDLPRLMHARPFVRTVYLLEPVT